MAMLEVIGLQASRSGAHGGAADNATAAVAASLLTSIARDILATRSSRSSTYMYYFIHSQQVRAGEQKLGNVKSAYFPSSRTY